MASTKPTATGPVKTADEGSLAGPGPDAAGTSAFDPQRRQEMIRTAAYAAFERRGCTPGHELEDWLQAEKDVDREIADQSRRNEMPADGAK